MTLIKTFPSWDPEADRARALQTSPKAALMAGTAEPGLVDSTDRLNIETDKLGRITGGHIETFQDIPDSFLRECADKRAYQNNLFAPDEVQVASVPAGLVDQWIREGFNIMSDRNITPEMIVARLKAEGFDKFITCDKIG